MTTEIDVRELPARFEEAIALASAGGEVVILEGLIPRARLIALEPAASRTAGLHPGALQPGPDFDAPLPENFWTESS